jgi:hypothetical protein
MGIPKLVHDSHFVSVVPETTVKTSKTAINGIVFVCFIIFTIVFLCISKFYGDTLGSVPFPFNLYE